MSLTSDVERVNVSDERRGNSTVPTPAPAGPAASYQKRVLVSGTVAVIGLAMAIVGAVMIVARLQVAAALLGARFFLGVPLTNLDAAKVTFIGIAGFVTIGIGVITIVGSVAAVAVVSLKRS
jgi:hypothetical protein